MITKEKIISLYLRGESIRSISLACSVSEGTVRKALITEGVYVPSEKAKRILEDYSAGMAATEIAKKYKIKPHALNAFLPYIKGSYKFPKSKIAQKRKEKGLTQVQFAKLLKVPQSTVGRWESGVHKPSFANLKKISEILDCTVEEIMEE